MLVSATKEPLFSLPKATKILFTNKIFPVQLHDH